MFKNARVVSVNTESEVYHSRCPGQEKGTKEYVLSRSDIVKIAACPYKWVKTAEDPAPTTAMKWGTLVEEKLLFPDPFDKKYVVKPSEYYNEAKGEYVPWHGSAKYCKEWAATQVDKVIISEEMLANVNEAVLNFDPVSVQFIKHSEKQVMVVAEWVQGNVIIPLKCLIDFVPGKDIEGTGRMLGDLKTSESASVGGWPRKVYMYDYYTQAAFYLDMYNAATGEDRTDFVHIIQESSKPFVTGRRLLSSDGESEFIDLGRAKYKRTLEAYVGYLKSNKWPDYDDKQDGFKQLMGFTFTEPDPWMIERVMGDR